jgi:hypothetical protein
MTGRTQTLPWWLWGEGEKTTENKLRWPVAFFFYLYIQYRFLFLEDCNYSTVIILLFIFFGSSGCLIPLTAVKLLFWWPCLLLLPDYYMMKWPRRASRGKRTPLTPNSALFVNIVLPYLLRLLFMNGSASFLLVFLCCSGGFFKIYLQ